jgi:FMN-dependent NADH-azoreductase
MPKIIIHNAETNEIIEREMNENELADFNARQIQAQAENAAEAAKAAERQAILDRLGLTAEEATLLLGGN